jgi:hypothetical protein
MILSGFGTAYADITLWDDESSFVNAGDESLIEDPVPAEINFNDNDFAIKSGGDNSTTYYSGSMSFHLWNMVGVTTYRDWFGAYVVFDDGVNPDPVSLSDYDYLSVWVYGTNSGSNIIFVVEEYDNDWVSQGFSYAFSSTVDNFIGWQRASVSITDFAVFPTKSEADLSQITVIYIFFDEPVPTVDIERGYRHIDLLELRDAPASAGSTAMSAILSSLSPFLALFGTIVGLAVIVLFFTMATRTSEGLSMSKEIETIIVPLLTLLVIVVILLTVTIFGSML